MIVDYQCCALEKGEGWENVLDNKLNELIKRLSRQQLLEDLFGREHKVLEIV